MLFLFIPLFTNSFNCIFSVNGFSISTSESDIGRSLELPAQSGQNAREIRLSCELNLNLGEKMTNCKWVHTFPDVWAFDNQQAFVMCTAGHESDNGQVCEDQGNIFDESRGGYNDPLNNPYTQYDSTRLHYWMEETTCGLVITNPHANDTGIWKCHVSDNNPDVGNQWAEVELYVANQSTVAITDPDLFGNSGVALEVDLSSSTQEFVDAECTAMYGIPPPDIIWYIDEPSNTVDNGADQTVRSDGTVISEMRMTLDSSSMSRYGIRVVNNYFSFALGCYPDQSSYFDTPQDGEKNPAEVLVFGTSGASISSLAMIICWMLVFILLESL